MKNFVNKGGAMTLTAGANLTSGAPVIVGVLLAIPVANIANGAQGAADIEGVFTLPKLSSAVVAAGVKLTWDVSAGEFILTSPANGDLVGCAVAMEAAGNGATVVKAKLLPGAGAVHST